MIIQDNNNKVKMQDNNSKRPAWTSGKHGRRVTGWSSLEWSGSHENGGGVGCAWWL
jgi:hypothetical protein